MVLTFPLEIRIADATDAQRIAILHATSWRLSYRGMLSDTYLDGVLINERTHLWVERLTTPQRKLRVVLAEVGDRLAGFACAFGSQDLRFGTLLDNLHVSSDFQQQGIGTRLMREIVTWCQAELPGEGLFLWVLEANARARYFYEQLDGTQVTEKLWQAPDGSEAPRVCYAWNDLVVLKQELTSRHHLLREIRTLANEKLNR